MTGLTFFGSLSILLPVNLAAARLRPSLACCRAMAGTGYFAGVSNIVQHLVAELFEDMPWLDGYLAENARRLGSSYRTFVGTPHRTLQICCMRDVPALV